jgi:hypothetical protein
VFNVPMVCASVLLAGLSAWAIVALVSEQNALSRAQRNGSDPVVMLSATRILGLRAQGDESLALVARGGGGQDTNDFNAVMGALGSGRAGDRGLLPQATTLAGQAGAGANAQDLVRTFDRYRAAHAQIASRLAAGDSSGAVAAAVSAPQSEAVIADRINRDLELEVSAAQRRFTSAAGDATSALRALGLAIPLLTVLAIGLALLGLRERLKEYQ